MSEVKAGQPTKYLEVYNSLAYKYCLLGATDVELSEFFDVSEKTINNWKVEHPEFLQSVIRGKHVADAEVANSFHKKALGYRYEEKVHEADESGELKLVKVTEKEQAPDAGAALNWLKNRQPKKWRDAKETKVTLTDDFEALLDDAND